MSEMRGSAPRGELPAPAAARLVRARWLDPRLLIGVVVVLLSVALGARVVAAADDTTTVWAVTGDLAPGITLAAADLRPVAVQLGNAASYLEAGGTGDAPVGYQVVRAVGAGELLPREALAPPGTFTLRTVAVTIDAATADGLARGRLVDVYAVGRPETAGGAVPAPRLVQAAVTVARVAEGRGALGAAGSTRAVSLLAEDADVPDLLAAVAGGQLFLVARPAAADRRTAGS